MKHITAATMLLLLSCNGSKNGEYCEKDGYGHFVCKNYEQNVLIEIRTYKNENKEFLNGNAFVFSPSGDTLTKAFYKKGKLIGSYFQFYSSNKPKAYFCFDSFNQDTLFFRLYNIDGEIINEGGEILYGKGYTGISDSRLQQDSVVEILSVIIHPPKSKMTVECMAVNSEKLSDTIRPNIQYFEPNQNQLILTNSFHLSRSGNYEMVVITNFHDSLKSVILKKTEKFDIEFLPLFVR